MGRTEGNQAWRANDRASAARLNAIREDVIALNRSPIARGMVDATGVYPARDSSVDSDTKFLAVITGSALQSGHAARWDYTFAEVRLTTSGYELVSGGRTGTAINLLELAHAAEPSASTAWYVWGVQSHSAVSGSAYPAGFRPRPFGGGGTSGTHKTDIIAEVTTRTDSSGNTVYTIHEVGSHDGTCS